MQSHDTWMHFPQLPFGNDGDKVENLEEEEEEEEEEGYIAFVREHVTRRLELTSRQMGTHLRVPGLT